MIYKYFSVFDVAFCLILERNPRTLGLQKLDSEFAGMGPGVGRTRKRRKD